MSFQRTRLSAERTLMSIIRTSLSLISFGFTIYQIFHKAAEQNIIPNAGDARRFGVALVLLGVALLIAGIVYHLRFMTELRHERETMASEGLIHGESAYPISLTLVAAMLLLAIGLFAIASMAFQLGPFG
ncbi:DUF202 domain-containing protein [Cereibacter sp. SYSU M97828]|nr:DUF202 domain-containing protein [Cereibacter flavus]